MKKKKTQGINRRTMLKATGAGLGLAATSKALAAKSGKLNFKNEDFYSNGEFNMEAAKDAIIALMKYHNYPVFKDVRDKLWISDYGADEFARVGLAANLFVNNEGDHVRDRYMLLDIFLLPNQMLPEHYHLTTKKGTPKMEAWLVRNGSSYIVGEGEPTPGLKEKTPKSQRESCTVWHAVDGQPGTLVQLNRRTARHWIMAGPEGVILSEVANFHDNDGVRHSNKNLVFP